MRTPGKVGMSSVGCGTEMSAYRVEIRPMVLSPTRDLRAFVFRLKL